MSEREKSTDIDWFYLEKLTNLGFQSNLPLGTYLLINSWGGQSTQDS